ncbi:MAG: VOC family protein [Chloroflexi bacterium]|uniref:VOC family protein n=1 Tax=Candidatus Chlorohelix allophototropha TaxID=3003348 RepID=A0A8T7LYY2_9CHLR|nr:VOC family protein [Chloroflexota bacterium]WJW66587.1 VOC family protein [Chloroflexota bacterium L227-S17]
MRFFGRKKQNKATSQSSLSKAYSRLHEPRITGIFWLGLKANDVLGEATFLERTLGLRFVDEGNTALGHHIIFNCGPVLLELVEGRVTWAHLPKPRRGSPDVALIPGFQVDDLAAIYANLNEREVPITQMFDQGWVSNLLFFDPERNIWQVSETRNSAPIGSSGFEHLGVLWLAVADLEAQLRFYRDLLGLPLVDLGGGVRPITERAEKVWQENGSKPELQQESENSGMGAVFFSEGTRLALSPGGIKPDEHRARVWGKDTPFQIGFRATGLKELAHIFSARGVSFSGPHEDSDIGIWISITDPEGNISRVIEPPPHSLYLR